MNTKPLSGKPKEINARLQRGVLRLALSFHGQHPELDKHLKELGTLIRNGKKDDELQNLIDEIVDTIVSRGITQNTEQRGGRSLSDLLHRIESKFPKSNALEKIQQELSLPLDKQSFEAALENAARLIAGLARSQTEAQDVTDQSGYDGAIVAKLLDRIDFSERVERDITRIKNRIQQHQDEVQLMRQLNLAAAVISTELSAAGNGDSFTSARDQFLLLMNLMPFPASLSQSSAKTRKAIEKAESGESLSRCIPEIAELTSTMKLLLQSEIDDLRNFLKSTVGRLLGLEAQIKHSCDFHTQSMDNAFNLEKNLGVHAEGMLTEIAHEQDVAAIKNAVSSHLDGIDASLKTFVATEDQRHQEARDKIDHMVTALSDLENEATELRDDLKKQHTQILVDPLTAILNRAGYDEYVNKEYQRWRRYQSNLTLAVIDLDNFKEINDNYGHAAGDKVLATVSRQLESQLRENDVICRYGGEEFVLILPETNAPEGIVILDKLRDYIANCNFHFQDTPVPVTLSCGVARFRADDSVDHVFDRADQAMYAAKRNGRNQVRSEDDVAQQSA